MRDQIAARTFSALDQRAFAALSGDWNPIHVDPIAARRTQAGAPVVHGVHAVLWTLDRLCATEILAKPISSLDVRFQKFIYTDTEVRLCRARETSGALHTALWADGLLTTAIKVSFASGPHTAETFDAPVLSRALEPHAPSLADLSLCTGHLPQGDEETCVHSFPHAVRHLGWARVAAIARLSAVVGMYCPGLHSIFGSLAIHLTPDAPEIDGLRFRVSAVDDRFSMVEIDVTGDGFSGTISAFLRQAPVAPPSLAELGHLGSVKRDAFAGTTALIIGGSRGLGALTAKAIAAGNGRVVITYLVGETEAHAIVDEIGPHACRALRYDAREAALPQLAELDWNVNQLYYFATTQIFRQKAELYAPARFTEFCDVYVNGFEAACSALRARGATSLSVFYPSSVAVEERPRDMTEYSMAKAAGELLCADMMRFVPNMRVIVKRLPRLSTDQTATVIPTQSADPLQVMLPIIQEMHDSRSITPT